MLKKVKETYHDANKEEGNVFLTSARLTLGKLTNKCQKIDSNGQTEG